eukprot:COSAG06_NODE_8609_length_2116_cov_1.253347_3_plen_102_part_00
MPASHPPISPPSQHCSALCSNEREPSRKIDRVCFSFLGKCLRIYYSNSPTRVTTGDALVNGTPRQKDAKGKNVRSATKGSPRKRAKSGEGGGKKTKKKKAG